MTRRVEQPDFIQPDLATAFANQGPSCRQCADCKCWRRGDDEWICGPCIACNCRRSARLGYGAWTRALLRPFILAEVVDTDFGPKATFNEFRIEYFTSPGIDVLRHWQGGLISSMLFPGGNLRVWKAEAAPERLPPHLVPHPYMEPTWRAKMAGDQACERCGPCVCWQETDGRRACRVCYQDGCRRQGHFGRGEWGRALLRPHKLVAVRDTEFATQLTISGFQLFVAPKTVDGADIRSLVGRRVCGLLYADGMRICQFRPPDPELERAYRAAVEG